VPDQASDIYLFLLYTFIHFYFIMNTLFEDDYNMNFGTACSIKYLPFSNIFTDYSGFVATVRCITETVDIFYIIRYATKTQ
jgi:hypothetical protein